MLEPLCHEIWDYLYAALFNLLLPERNNEHLIMISSIGGEAFTVSFDKPNGAHWFSVGFDPEYTKGFQVTLPQGHYIATAVTDNKRDTLQIEFEKGPQWLELSFDW